MKTLEPSLNYVYEKVVDWLTECVGVSIEAINLVERINGMSIETLNDIVYATTDYRDAYVVLEEIENEDEEDEEDEEEEEE